MRAYPRVPFRLVSVVIPAKNEEAGIEEVVRAVRRQETGGAELEVIVVDDGSKDGTVRAARRAGAIVVELGDGTGGGNPAAARNRGFRESRGDPVVFLDCDCAPREGWLLRLLEAHGASADVVGGSIALPKGQPFAARCVFYCSWYHVHPRRRGGVVRQHPPGNLSVRRASFEGTRGFHEIHPVAYAHEELAWQSELQQNGGKIVFEPRAVVDHRHRPGPLKLFRRSYRWGYSAIESKASVGITRWSGLYRYPWLVVAVTPVWALLSSAYVMADWIRAGTLEPILFLPGLVASRATYAAGMTIGGIRWLRTRGTPAVVRRARWE